MARKTIARKAAFLTTIHHPGTALCTRDDPEAHRLVAWFFSCIANAKSNHHAIVDNGNGDFTDEIVVSEALRQIKQAFDTIQLAERATSRYYRAVLESDYRCGSVSFCCYLAQRMRLWAGRKIAGSLISDMKGAHLREMEKAHESQRKHRFREHMVTNEGFDPFGEQEDHINTHYYTGSGSNTYHFSC